MNRKKDYSFNTIHEHLKTDAERRFFAHDAAILAATATISDAMERLGVTRSQLAERLERTPGFISQVMSGSRNMTLRTFADLAFALGLQVRGIELSNLGEMRVPYHSMDCWLDGKALREVSASFTAVTAAVASSEREVPVEADDFVGASLAA